MLFFLLSVVFIGVLFVDVVWKWFNELILSSLERIFGLEQGLKFVFLIWSGLLFL